MSDLAMVNLRWYAADALHEAQHFFSYGQPFLQNEQHDFRDVFADL